MSTILAEDTKELIAVGPNRKRVEGCKYAFTLTCYLCRLHDIGGWQRKQTNAPIPATSHQLSRLPSDDTLTRSTPLGRIKGREETCSI